MFREVLEDHLKLGVLANGYLLTGDVALEELADTLKKYGEVRVFLQESGINEIRQLKELIFAATSKRVFFVLDAARVNRLAFIPMLKMIEDAPEGRHFFVISKRTDELPATLRSRMLELNFAPKPESGEAILKFVESDYLSRSKIIEELAEDAGKFNEFLNALEDRAMKEKKHDFLSKTRLVREASSVFNIGRKMCLEYLTHLLP